MWPTCDSGGSWRSSCSLMTTSGKSPAWKHTTSLVIRAGPSLLFDNNKIRQSELKKQFLPPKHLHEHSCPLWVRYRDTYPSPQRTAFKTPTAAVVCLSKPWPMWSAWARVRSSNSISLGSLARGRYCRFFISLVVLLWVFKKPIFTNVTKDVTISNV